MADFSDPLGDFNPYAAPAPTADLSGHRGEEDDDRFLPARRSTRWWARVVDNLLFMLTILPALFARGGDYHGKDLPLYVYALNGVPVVFVFYQWFLVSTRGQTVGKRWTGIKVVRLDGSPVGFLFGVVLREWITTVAQGIPVVGVLLGLVDALMIFGDERRCVHDHIAATRVVTVTSLV